MANPILAVTCPGCKKESYIDAAPPGVTTFFAAVCQKCQAEILVLVEFERVELAGEKVWLGEIIAVLVDDAKKRFLEGMEYAEMAPPDVIAALKRMRTAGAN